MLVGLYRIDGCEMRRDDCTLSMDLRAFGFTERTKRGSVVVFDARHIVLIGSLVGVYECFKTISFAPLS